MRREPRGMSDDATPRVLRLRDAAEHVGITEKALRRRIERGSLASLRVDGLLAVRVADLYAAGLTPAEGSDAAEGNAPRASSAHVSPGGTPRRGAGESEALVALVEIMRDQAEELGRMRAIMGRAESVERELVAEREARARVEASYFEERSRATAAEARVRELEESLAAGTSPAAERRGFLGRLFG